MYAPEESSMGDVTPLVNSPASGLNGRRGRVGFPWTWRLPKGGERGHVMGKDGQCTEAQHMQTDCFGVHALTKLVGTKTADIVPHDTGDSREPKSQQTLQVRCWKSCKNK